MYIRRGFQDISGCSLVHSDCESCDSPNLALHPQLEVDSVQSSYHTMAERKTSFIKVEGLPEGSHQTIPTKPEDRLPDSDIRIEACDESDADKIVSHNLSISPYLNLTSIHRHTASTTSSPTPSGPTANPSQPAHHLTFAKHAWPHASYPPSPSPPSTGSKPYTTPLTPPWA